MKNRRRIGILAVWLAAGFFGQEHGLRADAPVKPSAPHRVDASEGQPSPQLGMPIGVPARITPPPDWLPHYEMDVHLDTGRQCANVKQVVRWTNITRKPVGELVFHVYPRFRPTKKDLQVYELTLESLRVDPKTVIDPEGRRLHVREIRSGDVLLDFGFDHEKDTVMRVALPQPVPPGATVEVTIQFDLSIPSVGGRLGKYCGVTNLLNWYPILAYHNGDDWDAPPYVAWHQPWLNEAGHYTVNLHLPPGEKVATSGRVVERSADPEGYQHLKIVGEGIRDFSIVASKRFEVTETEVDGIKVRVLAFPEHRYYARLALQTAVECLGEYGKWFGPYAYEEFEIVEAYFGWNGNESSGVVLIDERVFDAPHLGYVYIDNLISHEICHQWWYSSVGTDGYRESWMDEGLVSYFTQQRIADKYGAEAELLDWPGYLNWLPNIEYQTLQHAGFHIYRSRGGRGSVLAPLPEIGHIHNLFNLVYDRGSKIVGMIHHRIGDERFAAFLRLVYQKYQHRILFVADFQRELEEFTGESWQQFFDDWLRSPKNADWKIHHVHVAPDGDGYQTTVTIGQQLEINEPVEIGVRTDDNGSWTRRFPLLPEANESEIAGAQMTRLGPRRWQLTFHSTDRPRQITIDPERKILDAHPANNRWKWKPKLELVPLYTPVNEVPLFYPLDRPSIVAGPNMDEEGRIGARGSLILDNRYRLSPFLAFDSQDSQVTAGLETQFYNFPAPNVLLGTRYEHTLANRLFNDPEDQGRLYLRWIQAYTTSFIYENRGFLELYFRFGDNFFPDEDIRRPSRPGGEVYRKMRALGLWYHLDLQRPYWNPEKGFRFDATYELGFRAFGSGESFHRAWSQYSVVRRLPDGLGYLSDTRLVGRVGGGVGSPDNGQHFRFGGPLAFRGQRSEDTEGSSYWLASVDWRFPLRTDLDVPVYDNIVNWRSLYGSLFYDVGESYLFGSSQGVDHAVGAGLYFRLVLLSFVEQLTLRLEYGRSLRYDSDIAWFGIYHAF